MKNQRKVVLYIAMSLDGFIAGPDGDLSFLASVERPGEDYGYKDFIRNIDTVIMGRKTYDKVLSFNIPYPHSDKKSYILSRTERPSTENIIFYSGGLKALIDSLKNKEGKNIFLDGGAEIVNEFMKEDLMDEMIISIIPIVLGEGIRLFKSGLRKTPLELLEIKSFESGLVQMHYKFITPT